MPNCPLCHGHGNLIGIAGGFGIYRCDSCGGTSRREEAVDWSNTADINDGFTLPAQIDADHSLTIGE